MSAGPPGGGNGSCSSSNTYNIKVTEKQDASADQYFGNSPNSSIAAGGPWYTSNPSLTREGTGSVKGGSTFSITFNKPTLDNSSYEAYVKKVTVNNAEKSTVSYSTTVCEDQNIVIEYGMRSTSEIYHDVTIKTYLDRVHKKTVSDSSGVKNGETYKTA